MEVNVDILEQLELMDVSDQEALDVFLNSGAEDNSMTLPVPGVLLSQRGGMHISGSLKLLLSKDPSAQGNMFGPPAQVKILLLLYSFYSVLADV